MARLIILARLPSPPPPEDEILDETGDSILDEDGNPVEDES